MGSFARTFIPIGFAVVIGIANGYYAFKPAFQELQTESQKPNSQKSNKAAEAKDESQQQALKADSPPSRKQATAEPFSKAWRQNLLSAPPELMSDVEAVTDASAQLINTMGSDNSTHLNRPCYEPGLRRI